MRAEEQSKIREAAAGTIFLLIGTVCFASKSIWIKWAYQMGAEPDAVLLYRQLLAVPLFWLIFLIYRPPMPDGKKKGDLWKACGAGVLCFFLSPLLDFIGLNHVSAMVERILLMSYPLFVFGFTACRDRKMSSIQDLFAVLAVMFGLFLALGGWNAELFQANRIGAVFILLSSARLCWLSCPFRASRPSNRGDPSQCIRDDSCWSCHDALHRDKIGGWHEYANGSISAFYVWFIRGNCSRDHCDSICANA